MEFFVFLCIYLNLKPILLPIGIWISWFTHIGKLEQVLEDHKVFPFIVRAEILELLQVHL